MKINLKVYIILILFVFFVQAFFTNVNAASDFECRIENDYQQKVAETIKKKYNTENLSEDELKILKDTIDVANKDNYKILTSIIKKESIEDLSRVSDLKINENLKNSNADKKSYDIAYTLARKGLFTEISDEQLIKSVIKTMYDCETPIDDYKLTVYASVFLFHKENKYDFKTLLDNTTEENYEALLDEIKDGAKFDSKRFFPNNKEVAVILTNLPKSIQNEIEMQNDGKKITLSPARCIISPSYHITNMMLVSMDMYGASTKGAYVGLINPLNILSDIALAPFYLLMGHLLKDPIKQSREL